MQTEDFETGGLRNSNEYLNSNGGGGITSGFGHNGGNKALSINYTSDAQLIEWAFKGSAINSREIYVSWYEHENANGRMYDEMFMGGRRKTDYPRQDSKFDLLGNAYCGGFATLTNAVTIEPEGDNTPGGNYWGPCAGPTWGSWDQWELHEYANTPNVSDGLFEIYKNGVLIFAKSNANINFDKDMTHADVFVGGLISKFVEYDDAGLTQCTAPSKYGNGAYGPRMTDFSIKSPCPLQNTPNGYTIPVQRYIDDIILIKK